MHIETNVSLAYLVAMETPFLRIIHISIWPSYLLGNIVTHQNHYDIAHFDGHIKDFQKMPVVLSKCGAIVIELTLKIDNLRVL